MFGQTRYLLLVTMVSANISSQARLLAISCDQFSLMFVDYLIFS